MSQAMRDVRNYENKIKNLHDYGGEGSYSKACKILNLMSEIMIKANRSQKHKGETPIIHSIYISSKSLVDEMKSREDSDN